jgi:D-arabinose 1-dehydrogenase-like Zn-dependent alcohol dehydrogenase
VTVTERAARDAGALGVGAEAVVFLGHGRPLERIVVPSVVLRPGEALVAVELATLCPVDARILSGAEPTRGPLVLGHEQVGRVVAVALARRPRDVERHLLAVGDRVIWAAGVGAHRYGHDRVERGWELSGGCATHVQLLARTPVIRVGEDAPAAMLAPASCGTFTAEQLISAVALAVPRAGAFREYGLDDAELAFAALAAGIRVAIRPRMSRG